MGKFIDITGQVFGELTVIRRSENKDGKAAWECLCVCGEKFIAIGTALRAGDNTSCGHFRAYCKYGHERTLDSIDSHGRCKVCAKIKAQQWCLENPEQHYENGKRWYEENREKANTLKVSANAERKLKVLTHYSPNEVLGCCWEGCLITDIDMLTLDHINNDGAAHRKEIGSEHSTNMYRWAINNGFPRMFQTLCGGHQLKKEILRKREKKKN